MVVLPFLVSLVLVVLQVMLARGSRNFDTDNVIVSPSRAETTAGEVQPKIPAVPEPAVAAELQEHRKPAPPRGREEGAPTAPVTLHSDRISIQTAAMKACDQAGLVYEWRRSYDNTQPHCRRYIRVDLTGVPLKDALDAIVLKNGLNYRIEGKKVWLER